MVQLLYYLSLADMYDACKLLPSRVLWLGYYLIDSKRSGLVCPDRIKYEAKKIICYNSDKLGHIKPKCPLLKTKEVAHKAKK